MTAKFGTAGNPESFYEAGFKTSIQMPQYLSSLGLSAYEYQCGKGVNISEKTASELGKRALEYKISLSIHSPYYINLANGDEERRKKNISYILQTLEVAKWMGATRVVVHAGSLMGMTRQEALEIAKITLRKTLDIADGEGYGDIAICPETMGKVNQLGDLNEVIELCKLDERLIPTIDFGHLNARTLGGLAKTSDFALIFNQLRQGLGEYRMKHFHSHFSRIEYTRGGEKRHLTFEDNVYGPDFWPVAELICERGASPVIICESAGTQAIDAVTMKNMLIKAEEKYEKKDIDYSWGQP
jgi:deoxyribonuclease-4